MARYTVLVGNIGIVYDADNEQAAIDVWRVYVELSERSYGRASGESVTLFRNDDVMREHHGRQDKE